ncbi:hypothetical protein [Halomicrobium urmianum]|uniref:hypothetical protein n=1 Tax=Halomicrobium urmianum TaxID=1586233 RepID=UPI001CDA46D2|nr:hypothetical protein [Halomicrobium urmianum]
MRDSLAVLLTFVALVPLVFGLTPMLAPPDPFTQVRMWLGGTVAAAVVAVRFVRGGADRLDATVADVWLFVVGTVAVLFVGQVFVVGLARSQVENVPSHCDGPADRGVARVRRRRRRAPRNGRPV